MIEQKYSEMKTVTILLTRYSDLLGRFISAISKYHYSHVSISIDEREDIFYSFNMKGFVVEKPKQRCPRKRAAGSICIRLQVPESTYQVIQAEINEFLKRRDQYKYSFWGVVLCLMHIPYKFQNAYFCSQFVAEILAKAGAIELKKKESLYLPGNLVDGIEGVFSRKQLLYNVIC